MVGVDGKAVFPLHLIPICLYRSRVDRLGRSGISVLVALSSIALVTQAAQHQLTNPYRRYIRPSVHQIVLAQLGHIHKSVAVAVMIHLSVLKVKKGSRRKTVVKVYATVQVDLCFQFAVLIDIRTHAVNALRFQKLYVYLSRSAFVTVFHARCSLAYLYRLHPWAWHISQTVRQGCASQIRNVFSKHLYVCAAQSKQLYLPCSGSGVAVAYIHRWVGGKRLAKVAASRTYQLTFLYYLSIICSEF